MCTNSRGLLRGTHISTYSIQRMQHTGCVRCAVCVCNVRVCVRACVCVHVCAICSHAKILVLCSEVHTYPCVLFRGCSIQGGKDAYGA